MTPGRVTSMADSRAKEALDYLDNLIVQQQAAILRGQNPTNAAKKMETMAQYEGAVMLNASMTRLRKQIAEIFSKEEEDEDDGQRTLQE